MVVDVGGRLVGSGSADLDHVLRDLIEHQGNLNIVVDLHDVDHANPEGLAVLVAVSGLAEERGASLLWRDSPPSIQWHLDLKMTGAAHPQAARRSAAWAEGSTP